jgi:3-hydroxyacyl-CoA dehydrogenase/enoyl-CoA hydratase/3-hydroxybutyryl-CoA epimerase
MNETTTKHYRHWQLERDGDGILWLAADKADAGANVLSADVLEELNDILAEAERSKPAGLVVWSAKRSGFIMGADINEFTRIQTEEEAYELVRRGQSVLDRLEALPVPTVAAIGGFALGGGLELAIACDYRVGIEGDRKIIGLPEVKLGIHPGFGGTVRSVRLAGPLQALPLMLAGNSITVGKAQEIGLIDRIAAADDWRDACRRIIAEQPRQRRTPLPARLLNLRWIRPLIARRVRRDVARKARETHYPAPFAIIDLWVKHGGKGPQAYEAEARSIAALMNTSASRNLVRVFFLQNKLKAQGSRDAEPVERVHVVGAGVMGGDIAAWCALRGMQVSLQDRDLKYIKPALERAHELFRKRLRSESDRQQAQSRLLADVAGDQVAEADLVIEAIFEDRDAKQALYADLVPKMKAGAILATNTSSIRLESLREGLPEPRRFIGLHFFNPVAQLPLVEVIRCEDSDADAVDRGVGFVKKIGKTPLVCRSAPGFVVNRILAPYMAEAMHLQQEGEPLAAIDEAAVEFGMPMGPVELADSVGLDVVLHVAGILGGDTDTTAAALLQSKVKAGELGRKSGRGFYEWRGGKAVKPAVPDDYQPPADLCDRLILPMVNEALRCLAEGVVEDAELLDAGVIFGTGFAPFRGGPLRYASERGLDETRTRMEQLAAAHGERLLPDAAAWEAFRASQA